MDIKQIYPIKTVTSMTEQQLLIAEIIKNPDDNTVRLVYCDWLDESGCPHNAALAAYIRISIELHIHKTVALVRKDSKIKNLEVGEGKGNDTQASSWYEDGIELHKQEIESCKKALLHPLYVFLGGMQVNIDRGFISSITCTASQFLEVCDRLLWHPSIIDECVKCYGKGMIEYKDRKGYIDHYLCKTCRPDLEGYRCGTGKLPRSCPLTAHPIREVIISLSDREQAYNYGIGDKIEEWGKLAPKYNIKFTIV